MGFLQPRIETRQPRSQATPLAEDVLGLLRKQILGGTFGEGAGSLQREAGTAIRQFVNARQTPDLFKELAAPIMELQQKNTETNAANLRESFGIGGNRFGTSLATGEAQLRNDSLMGMAAILSQLFSQQQSELLQGIAQMFGQGQANVAPAFGFAQQGVLPEEFIIKDSPFKIGTEFLSDLAGIAGTAAGAGR